MGGFTLQHLQLMKLLEIYSLIFMPVRVLSLIPSLCNTQPTQSIYSLVDRKGNIIEILMFIVMVSKWKEASVISI